MNANSPSPLVSVVINYHNESENVDLAPKYLCEQTYKNFEVILVDDASTDGTTELILKKYGRCFKQVRVFKMSKVVGLRVARNYGVRESTGDIIITLDLHTVFGKRLIENIVNAFLQDKKLGAVASLVLPLGTGWFHKGHKILEYIAFKIRSRIRKYGFVIGCAAAYRKEALQSITFLSTNEVVEDVDASWKMIDKGWRITFLENNVVYHKEPQTFKKWVKKYFKSGLRAFFVTMAHKDRVLSPPSLVRILWIPVILLIINQIELVLLLIVFAFLMQLALLVLAKLNKLGNMCIKDVIYAIPAALLLLTFQSIGFYYAILLYMLKKIGMLERINVDIER